MGIYPQPNSWLCGPFALKHGLLMLGIVASEDELARTAGTDETGTDETELARAAARYGARLGMVRRHAASDARRDLTGHLQRGVPVLLCVEQWGHWIVAVATDGERFVVLDSKEAGVVTVLSWDVLERLWAYVAGGGKRPAQVMYDLHPLVPGRPGALRARLTVDRARDLARSERRWLARRWDRYVEALVTVARGHTAGWDDLFAQPLSRVLRDAERLVVERWAKGSAAAAERARRFLQGLQFVTEAYDVTVRSDQEATILDATVAALQRWERSPAARD